MDKSLSMSVKYFTIRVIVVGRVITMFRLNKKEKDELGIFIQHSLLSGCGVYVSASTSSLPCISENSKSRYIFSLYVTFGMTEGKN